jgi:hypothetical protein
MFVAPINLVGGYRRFEKIYNFHGQDRGKPVWECGLNLLELLPSVTRTVYC